MDKASLCASLGMGPVAKVMPRPRNLAGEIVKPFVFVLGGMAICLAALYLMIGQDPTVPVTRFLADSGEAVAPFAAFLSTVWLLYLWIYVLAGASLSDLWMIVRTPDWFAGLLRRLYLSLHPGSTLVVCLIAASSLVRLYRPCLPVRPAVGWRSGDSVQLE